jgi:hypothetical protein
MEVAGLIGEIWPYFLDPALQASFTETIWAN